MSDGVNAVYLGKGKDELGFACSILEDPVTKRRYAAYSLEVWQERVKFLNWLMLQARTEDKDGNPSAAAD